MSRKRSLMWFGMAFLLAAICLAPFGGAQAAEKTEILVGAINSYDRHERNECGGVQVGL